MLPTTGFFKDIDCPFYENTCGRPYCHFRHRKKNLECSEDSQDSTEQSQDVPTYNPTPKSQLQNVRSHIPISYVPDIVVRTERSLRNPPSCTFSNVTYKPTPISELSKNKSNNGTGEELIQITDTEIGDNRIDFGDDIDLTSECALIDDIINEKNEENVDKVEEKKAPDKVDVKSTKEKEKGKKDEKNKSSKSKPSEKTNKSESKEKSRSKSDHRSSSSSKDKDKKNIKTSESKSTKTSHKHKDSKDNKDKRKDLKDNKDKHKDYNENKHKSKHKEKSKDYNQEKSKDYNREKLRHKTKDSKDRDKSKSKEKHRKKKKSESENEEKINPIKELEINYNDLDYLDDDDDDLENPTLEEECYRIFNEYKPEPIKLDLNEHQTQQEYIPTPKKRIAHQGADNITPKITHEAPKPSQNPALAMMNRFKVARQAHANNEQKNIILEVSSMKRSNSFEIDSNKNAKIQKTVKEIVKEPKKISSKSLIDDIINGTPSSSTHVPKTCDTLLKPKLKKIAPVQNVYSIQQAKAKIAEIANRSTNSSKSTPIQTISKGSKRVAHIPDMSMGDIPDVLQSDSKKIPINVRTRYLTLLADECLKLYLLKQDAYARALNEEVKVMERCSAIVTYRNSAMLSVNRIRKELQEREAKGLGPISPDDTDPNAENSPFKGKKFYRNVFGYLLTEDDLDTHGYPREGPVPGKAVIKSQKSLPKVNLNPNQRLCCRCFKVYMVDPKGFSLYDEECQYHPLKKRTIRGDRIYLCCKSSEEMGCATAARHVCESEADLEGYQTTLAPSSDNDPRSYAVYALDCEMCYTTRGLELTRVTIVDSDSKTVYESLVKPLHPIVDYNTQFSGITKEQMDRTSTSILQVQANILHLCNSKTILIGHSLESDMKALKIVHSSIIDTSVLFPHRLGLPHKKALRVLASEYLKKIIQNDIGGHDSAEDAITCMELVIWKLKEDLKVRNVKT